MHADSRPAFLALLCALGAACSSTPPAAPPGLPEQLVADQRARVEAFFGSPFPHTFETRVLPDRASFADFTAQRWGFRADECWMVAVGTGSVFAMIDPDAWPTQACEHDPNDAEHVRGIVAHELVHVYHGQHNADPEFDSMEELGWFAEGLAVYASGQFDEKRRTQAVAASIDAWPERLSDAWSGQARYAVAGAIAAWIDETYGRQALVDLLAASTTSGALSRLDVDEPTLLADVRAWLQAPVEAPGESTSAVVR
jgi:hypothetical protein